MMKKLVTKVILLLFLLFMNSEAWALVASNDFFGLDFRFNNPGARSTAMGGAFVGLADDATAAYASPAGLTILTEPEISAEFKYGKYTNRVPQVTDTDDFTDNNHRVTFLSLAHPTEKATITVYRHHLVNITSEFDSLEDVDQRDEIEVDLDVVTLGVVIGNKDYQNKDIPAVSYAIQDAALVKECLIKTFGYRDGNVIFKTNATKGVFENIFGSAQSHKGMLYDYLTPGKSDVFVYYSGHGAPSLESKKGYVLPVDGNPNNVSISGYSLDLLYGNLAKLQARTITVVTDACFSGAPLFKKARPVGIIVKNPLVARNDTSIMNSSSGTELSSWYPQKGHGLFTYYLLLGMTGKADIDRDKKITMHELSNFISDNVPCMARKLHDGPKQTPTFKTADSDRVLVVYR